MKNRILIVSLFLFILLATSFISDTDVIADEPEYEFVFALMVHEDNPFTIGARYFKKEVENRTNGRVQINVCPGGVLGTAEELWESMQEGNVDLIVIAPALIGLFVPEYNILGLPYLFKNIEHLNEVVPKSEPIETLNKILEEKGNVIYLGHFGGSPRNLLSKDIPILSLNDLPKVRMRSQAVKLVSDTWGALGARLTIIAYPEVYTALQTGIIGAAENEYSTFITRKWYEPCKYITRTKHELTVRPCLMAANKFNSLPKDIQKIIREVGEEATKYGREVENQKNDEYVKEMEEHGIEFFDLHDREKWIDATEEVRKKYARQYGCEDIYTQIKTIGENF